eukprot:137482_1
MVTLASLYDVVIVGAGFGGLAAGLYLKDNNTSNTLILESRNRVGGRTSNDSVQLQNGKVCTVESGGAYVGPKQPYVLNMAKRYNIPTYKVYSKGDSVTLIGDQIYLNEDLPNDMLLDLDRIMKETDRLTQQINTIDVTKSKLDVAQYDSITVEQWIESIVENKQVHAMYKAFVTSLTCREPQETSMLFWLYLVTSAHSLTDMITTENGAQDSKVVGGTFGLSQMMAQEIGGDKIRLNHRVTAIEQKQSDGINFSKVSCRVSGGGTVSFNAKYVLFTAPPPIWKTIKFVPQLSEERRQISKQYKMGWTLKTYLFFKTPFWRDNGYDGSMFSTQPSDPVSGTFDASKPDGSYYAIMGFIEGDNAKQWMRETKEKRKQAILHQYARAFNHGESIDTECIGYFDKFWSGYAAIPRVGAMSKYYFKQLKEDENDGIHFAGTELADEWVCYIEGAIQAGQREAQKIGKKLNSIFWHSKL